MLFGHENQDRRSRFFEPVRARLPRLPGKVWTILTAAVVTVFIFFLAGSWYGQRQAAKSGAGARKILYYVDPMNPAHTSPEPGLAPCGMKMEPVFADEVDGGEGGLHAYLTGFGAGSGGRASDLPA